jgi:hydrogenase nickel incorporation protein HypA/HybF
MLIDSLIIQRFPFHRGITTLHEYSTAVGIVQTAISVAKKNNATAIKKVELSVGEFTMLNSEQLTFAFQIAAEGSIAEEAELLIEKQSGKIKCEECGFEGVINQSTKGLDHFLVNLQNIFECPKCHSNRTKIVGGRDVFVKNIEVEIETEPENLPEATSS